MNGKSALLFVCLGNICRSPLAEAAFRAEAERLGKRVHCDSAGTGAYHIGNPPDPRSISTAFTNGADIAHLSARQLSVGDFDKFDHIFAMDQQNLSDIRALAHENPNVRKNKSRAQISLLMDHVAGQKGQNIADPYYGDDDGFDQVWRQVSLAAQTWFTG